MAMLIVRAFRSLGYISFGQLVNGSPQLVASCECKLLCFADVVAAAAAIALLMLMWLALQSPSQLAPRFM